MKTMPVMMIISFAMLAAADARAASPQPIVQIELEDDAGVVTVRDLRVTNGYPDRASDGPHRVTLLDAAGGVVLDRPFGFQHFIDVPPGLDGQQDPPVWRSRAATMLNLPFVPDAKTVRISAGAVNNEFRIAAIPAVLPVPAAPPELIHQGCADESQCFKFLYISEDYAQADLAEFAVTAQAIADEFLAMEPYVSIAGRMNIYRLDNLTDLGCAYNCSGIQRLICCDSGKVSSAAAGAPHDEVLVIVNNNEYGGSGYVEWSSCFSAGSFAVTFKGIGSGAREVAVHETGHSMGGLWDEYEGNGTHGSGTSPNCTQDSTCQQWAGVSGTGCFAGCTYSDYYRSTDNGCLMKTLSPSGGFQFCPVCIDHFKGKIDTCIGGQDQDAGYPDTGYVDAGTVDAGHTDAGVPDAGHVDAGLFDAGPKDAGRADTGINDAGHFDGGTNPQGDGGRDSGMPDAGPIKDGGVAVDSGDPADAGEPRKDAGSAKTDAGSGPATCICDITIECDEGCDCDPDCTGTSGQETSSGCSCSSMYTR